MSRSPGQVRKLLLFGWLRDFLTSQRQLVRAYFGYRYLKSDPYGSRRHKEQIRVDRALTLLDGVRATNALDIGCGEGYEARRLAQIAQRVLAIDISDTAIRRARKLNRSCDNIDFDRGDFLTFPLLAGSYDLVYCSEVLYYLEIEQLEAARRKLIEVLRPDGQLLLVHHRSSRDEATGSLDKRFGARTIHDLFLASADLLLQDDILFPEYRITLLRRGTIDSDIGASR